MVSMQSSQSSSRPSSSSSSFRVSVDLARKRKRSPRRDCSLSLSLLLYTLNGGNSSTRGGTLDDCLQDIITMTTYQRENRTPSVSVCTRPGPIYFPRRGIIFPFTNSGRPNQQRTRRSVQFKKCKFESLPAIR